MIENWVASVESLRSSALKPILSRPFKPLSRPFKRQKTATHLNGKKTATHLNPKNGNPFKPKKRQMEIGNRVGRNQTTVMRICDRWMQEGTMDRHGRSHPPQCTISRPFLGLPLTQNHRRLRRQWCDERRMWVAELNEVVFTDESRICLQHHDGRIRV
ncbi:transposable element Tcb1 transposase [Trichonephila clavipes]|nr:transposable element Tcb1 transposase [Trichonephila clavipes]